MANTPKYVRLAERLNRTIVADVLGGSRWLVARIDVKEFPDPSEEPAAWNFATSALRDGRLEEATADQYNAVQYANKRVSEAGQYDEDAGESINEGLIQVEAKKAYRDLLKNVPEPVAEDEDEGEGDEFDAMTRDELVEYAKEVHDVELAGNVSKADAL